MSDIPTKRMVDERWGQPTLADDLRRYILPCHSAEVREWWNMRDGSPTQGAWNFYFGRHPELGDALLLRLVELKANKDK